MIDGLAAGDRAIQLEAVKLLRQGFGTAPADLPSGPSQPVASRKGYWVAPAPGELDAAVADTPQTGMRG